MSHNPSEHLDSSHRLSINHVKHAFFTKLAYHTLLFADNVFGPFSVSQELLNANDCSLFKLNVSLRTVAKLNKLTGDHENNSAVFRIPPNKSLAHFYLRRLKIIQEYFLILAIETFKESLDDSVLCKEVPDLLGLGLGRCELNAGVIVVAEDVIVENF
jgi:hypothetical protein